MKNIIGISGINATDNPGPGCGVARSLIESNISAEIIGLSYDVNDPGNYMSNIFSNSFILPYPSCGFEIFKKSLLDIKNKTALNTLIPCLDAELPLLIKHHDELNKIGIRTILPTEEQFDLRSKDKLTDFAKTISCLHPKTIAVNDFNEMVKVLQNDINFPAVIKGKYYQAYIVHNIESAVAKAIEITAKWGFPLLVQEQIEGQEYNLIALSNYEGHLKGAVSIKKQLTTNLGKVWTAVTIHDEKLNKICHDFVKETKWRGPFELEMIVNKEGVYLIEINPRFPSWVYFATTVGINLPQMLIEIINSGDCKEKFEYSTGKYLVRYSSEFAVDIEEFQNLISHKNRNQI
ncbi:MAG: ATP-grasp domain-containing protein [Rickettsiales bacterium]|nr:ATP-grasp domain-containing protein [Rickettsiales bacterium]